MSSDGGWIKIKMRYYLYTKQLIYWFYFKYYNLNFQNVEGTKLGQKKLSISL